MKAPQEHARKRLRQIALEPLNRFLLAYGGGGSLLFFTGAAFNVPLLDSNPVLAVATFLGIPSLAWGLNRVYTKYRKGAFIHQHYHVLWGTVVDRMNRFETAYRSLAASWGEEMPALKARLNHTADTVYAALLRADVMQAELQKSEGQMEWSQTLAPRGANPSPDRKVQELYQLADRNIAEYRQRLQAITAGIQRCEAQTAVFVTTLDNLRVRLLGYRLMGKSPEIEHKQFLETISEAKSQLESVDLALSELSFDRLMAQIELEDGVKPSADTVRDVMQNQSPTPLLNAHLLPPALPEDVQIEDRNS